ncbi:MAG: amidohydrolase family protein [Candidatus Gracilibacteria bacterium]|nr:amidohydrolase family protein [Candidatus Gracilibacteria bacterium]MDD3120215.1 amidohydrolase family protein [Candidatus Gracilibacteria bacterium]MDD4529963.1 amidohydrolase family protein [Candidatus Gracilibacteria bacterium]
MYTLPKISIIPNKDINEINKSQKKQGFINKINNLDRLNGCKYPIIDAHVHVVDFNQKIENLEDLLYYMDKSNILKAVIFGLPVKKNWAENERLKPAYYLEDDSPCYYYSFTDTLIAQEYLKLSKEKQDRLYPLICGFNPMDIDAIEHIKYMFKYFPGVFSGIGEIFYRHDDLTLLTYGDSIRINTKATYPILEFATDYDLPILIHNNITSAGISDNPKYLYELEKVLKEFPKAKVVLAHCGASRRVYAPYYHKMVERILNEYPSLYIDYSWIIFEEIITKDIDSQERWLDITEKFSDRIMIGSDVLGNTIHKIGATNSKYNDFLTNLSEKARQNVCINTAMGLYGNSKNKVENGEKRTYCFLEELG